MAGRERDADAGADYGGHFVGKLVGSRQFLDQLLAKAQYFRTTAHLGQHHKLIAADPSCEIAGADQALQPLG